MIDIIKGQQIGPRRLLYHGTNWVGKTTFAAQAIGGCLLVNLEDDKDVDCHKTHPITTWESFMETMIQIYEWKKFPYKWLAIDTLDALERIIQQKVVSDAKQKNSSVDSFGHSAFDYGRGNKLTATYWDIVMRMLKMNYADKDVGIILLCHSETIKVIPADAKEYNRYEPAVHEYARDLFCDWVQEIFFGDFRTYVSQVDVGFNRTRGLGVGGKDRFVKTEPTASVRAKNRLKMPEEIENFTFADYASYFPKATAEAVEETSLAARV